MPVSQNDCTALYALRRNRIPPPFNHEEISMNRLLSALFLGAFALVHVPALAQAAKSAAPAASAASAPKADEKKAAAPADAKAPAKKEKKGGC